MRTLTVLLATVMVVMLAAVIPSVSNADVNTGIGISTSTSTPQSTVGTRFELHRQGRLLAMVTSTMGMMPVVYSSSSLTIDISCDPIGYRSLKEVTFTATNKDGKILSWKASRVNVESQTFTATISAVDLPPGAYSCGWTIKSKDKTKNVDLLLFEINVMKNRETATSNYLLVQEPPLDEEFISNPDAFGYLRGFEKGWATPDPGYLAQQQMLASLAQQQQSQGQQGQQPPPAPQPPTVTPPAPQETLFPPTPTTYSYELSLCCNGRDQQHVTAEFDEPLSPGDKLVIMRAGKVVATVKVVLVSLDKEYADASGSLTGSCLRVGDTITIKDREEGEDR